MRAVKVCDTTLRDSEYSTEYSLSVKEKVEIAKQLERLGVDMLELGAANEALGDVAKALLKSRFSAACLPQELDDNLLRTLESAKKARVNLLYNEKRADGFLTGMPDVVKRAKERGFEVQVTVDVYSMDAGDFLRAFCAAAKQSGADSLCVYDDTGYCAPTEFYGIVKNAIGELDGVPVAVKCKNDLGMGVANVLSAIKAGAAAAECGMNGLGRRAGNAALEEVVMGIYARSDYYEAETGIKKRLLYRTSRMVAAVVGQPVPGNKPIVGARALVRGNSNIPEDAPFRAIRPEEIGVIRNNLLLGAHSSPHIFEERVGELGYLLNPVQMGEAYALFTDLCKRKSAVSDRDIEAIVAPMDASLEKKYTLVSFEIHSGSKTTSIATVVLKTDGGEVTRQAAGSGPVEASYTAIDDVTGIPVELDAFSLQSVTEGEDALGDAVVRVKFGENLFTGRGVSTDIVESAIRAYVNALNKVAAVM